MTSIFSRIALVLLLMAAAAPAETNRTSVLLVYDSADTYALSCFEQAVVTFEYNRVPYTVCDIARSPSLPDLGAFTSVVTVTEMLWKIDAASCDELTSFVQNGGGLAVLYRAWNANLHTLLGVTATQPPLVNDKKSKGLKFVRELIPGINHATIPTSILGDISSYDLQLLPGTSVFATTLVDDHPAAWVNTFGRGKVVYWNSVLLGEKIYRGFIIPSLGAVQPMTLSPILNVGVICMDDFPNASPNVKLDPIRSEFNMTVSEFYAFQWYPDMLKLAKQYGLHFTAGLIFSYGEITTPPYKFSEWVNSSIERGGKTINASVWLAREAQKDIEVALHGHNHQPLTLGNWRTIDNMKLALSAAQKRWQYDNLGPAPLSYIPPMNIIDSVGMRALADVFPTIRVVGGQYMGKFALGQNREFGSEPWNPKIKDIPRVTSGFIFDDFNKVLTVSLINTVGAWTHFVHPDDILPSAGRYAENTRDDNSAENLYWRGEPKKTGIYYSFEKWVKFVRQNYPWLRFTDYAHAYQDVSNYEATSVVVKASGREIDLRVNITPGYYTLHLNNRNRIASCTGGEIVQQNALAFSSYYVIRARKHDLVITLRDSVPPVLYRAGMPKNLYLAGDSRYLAARAEQNQYPTTLASVSPVRTPRPSRIAAGPIADNGLGKNIASAKHSSAKTHRVSEAIAGTASEELSDSALAQKTIDAQKLLVLKDPKDAQAWRQLKNVYEAHGMTALAVECSEHLMPLVPNDTVLAKSLARQYIELDRKEKAIPIYETILQKYPRDAGTWHALYQLYTWSDLPRDAIRALEGYVQCAPADEAALRQLAELYVGAERQHEAIPLYEKLLARNANQPALRRMLAQLYAWNNLHDKAALEYERLYASDKRDTSSARKAVQEFLAVGQTENAARIIEDMLDRMPDDRALRGEAIALYRGAGMMDKALLHAELIEQQDPDNAENHRMLAEMYLESNQAAKATLEYEAIVRKNPNDLAALKKLGELYLWQERQPDAIRVYERIVRAEPDSLPSRLTLARLYSWNKRPHDASIESKRILRRDITNLEALKLAAEGDRAEDDWFDARAWYSMIADREPHNKDASDYLDAVRRDHGLQFSSAYERVEDSNNLTREEMPVSVELLQMQSVDYYLRLNARRVSDSHLILNPGPVQDGSSASRAGRTENGYGVGLGSRYMIGKNTALTFEALITQYDSSWMPLTLRASFEHSIVEGFSVALKLEQSETVEGIQAIRDQMYTTSARGELFLQATSRWSIGALAEVESYTDDNMRSTGEIVSTLKIVLKQPEIAIQAGSIYQDTKRIYPSSEPYWTPRRLFTNSVGASIGYTFFDFFTPQITEAATWQGGVFSNNLGGKATLQLSQFIQLNAEYGKLGSSVYRQTVARASLSYRY
jgi:tetratricopeptide (TPR) repeat protein